MRFRRPSAGVPDPCPRKRRRRSLPRQPPKNRTHGPGRQPLSPVSPVARRSGTDVQPVFEYQHYKIAEQKPEIAVVESLVLPDLVKEANMNSNNLYAEALLRHLSNSEPTNKYETTVNQGLKILKAQNRDEVRRILDPRVKSS